MFAEERSVEMFSNDVRERVHSGTLETLELLKISV